MPKARPSDKYVDRRPGDGRGRKRSKYTAGISGAQVRPDVASALYGLVETTGYSQAHFIRAALEAYLGNLSLIEPQRIVPERTGGRWVKPNKKRAAS